MRYPTEGLQQDLREQIERGLTAYMGAAKLDLSWLAALLGNGFAADACAVVVRPERPIFWWAAETAGALERTALAPEAWEDAARSAAPPDDRDRAWVVANLDTAPLLAACWRQKLPAATTAIGWGLFETEGAAEATLWVLLARSRPWEPGYISALEELATTFRLVLACWQQQQRIARDSRVRKHLTRACHGSTTDSERIQQIALDAIAEVTQAERALILMLKYDEPLRSRGTTDRQHIPKAKLEVARRWLPSSAAGTAIAPQPPQPTTPDKTLTLADSPICGRAWQASPEPIALAASDVTDDDPLFVRASVLIAPLTGRSSPGQAPMVLGFLALQRSSPQGWSTGEVDLVDWVAIQLSTTLLYNRTLLRVQGLVDERTAQLKSSLDVQAKLYENRLQQVEQLRQANLLKDEFLSTISHELNTPLATMRMAARMLREPELPAERRDRYLEILEQELKRESDLIGDLLTLQQMESEASPLQPQPLDLKHIIAERVAAFTADARALQKGLQLEVTYDGELATAPKAIVYSEADSIQRILQELLTNAGKYADPDTTVSLEVAILTEPPERVAIAIANVGPGIAPAEIGHIFEKFRRGRGATQQAIPGTGLGLALVKCLVQHLQGTIEVASDYREGAAGETRFVLTLPETPEVG